MDTLTKIFIVVLVVLVLLACPVVIGFVAARENYRQDYLDEKTRNNILQTMVRTANLDRQAAIERQNDCQSKNQALQTRLEGRVEALEMQLNEERGRAADLQQSLQTLTAQFQGINSSLEASTRRTERLSEQLQASQEEENQLRQDKLELSDALRNAEARADRLTGQIRLLREKLASSQQRVQELEDRLAAAGAAEEPSERPVPPAGEVTAEVTTVDGNIVGINAGSAQGIGKGMRLIIYRDARLVGQVDIDEVDVGSSAGIVVSRQLDPRPGDKVTTSLE